MILNLPLFENLKIKNFQGIEEKEFEFRNNVNILLIPPISGKSSFFNSLSFLYTGDIRNFDNYGMVYNLTYDNILSLIYNNNSTKFEDLVIENDYLKLTGSQDLSILSETDLGIVNDYIVRCIFKRQIDNERIKNFIPTLTECKVNKIENNDFDYSYLCYDKDKFAFESRMRDLANLFYLDDKDNLTNQLDTVYRELRMYVPKLFEHDVYLTSKTNIAIGKNGKMIYTIPSTISSYMMILSSIYLPSNNTIVFEDFISNFQLDKASQILSTFNEALFSNNYVQKRIIIVADSSKEEYFRNLVDESCIIHF